MTVHTRVLCPPPLVPPAERSGRFLRPRKPPCFRLERLTDSCGLFL